MAVWWYGFLVVVITFIIIFVSGWKSKERERESRKKNTIMEMSAKLIVNERGIETERAKTITAKQV